MHVPSEHRLPVVVPAALAAAAWIGIIVWSRSPHAAYLSHDALTDIEWGRSWTLPLLLGGWTLMSAAMMLPAYVPTVVRYRRADRRQRQALPVVGALIAGYLTVWTAVGAGILVIDLVVHGAGLTSPTLLRGTWMLLPAIVAIAGLYQLTTVRERCLAHMLVADAGGEPAARSSSLRAGLRHGVLCSGASWPLMLLMFAAGHGNVVAMMLIGGVMTVERVSDWGRRHGPSLGPALLCAAPLLLVLRVTA